jgi:glycosyltransferase involved in cell wall biosynthesis
MLAMTFGKPIVAPAIASIPEYADSSMAELFDATDPDGLAKALEAIMNRDLTAMGKAGEEHARRFSWKEMASVHARAYQCVATRQPLTRVQPQ